MFSPRLALSRTIKKDSVVTFDFPYTPDTSDSSLQPEYLRSKARWIRDVLDPQVASEGPDALHSDEILTLDELLRKLLESTEVSLADIRYSRMHLAIADVCGRATRWPKKLVDRCDAIKVMWEAKFGKPLRKLGTPLYEKGGRLHGICKPEDLSKERLLARWLRSPDTKLSPAVSRRTGDLGFVPGEWWISTLFAHRAGIIDSASSDGCIVSDLKGAYAIVMTGDDEVSGSDPSSFQYRARAKDNGRYRLTAANPESRQPVRILRSHSLHSFWRPRAGVRYDGLHTVSGWTIKKDAKSNEIVYLITFKRLPNEIPMDSVLCRPWSDEVEDYSEYKRLRQIQDDPFGFRLKPSLTFSADATVELFEGGVTWTLYQEQVMDRVQIDSRSVSPKTKIPEERLLEM